MIGQKIRELREKENILLRQLAAKLDIDTALLSKMERGERYFKKIEIENISKELNYPIEELTTIWLAYKILKELENEPLKKEALKYALKVSKE
jgi:HTH-type transcriptional regulator, competence development regulator